MSVRKGKRHARDVVVDLASALEFLGRHRPGLREGSALGTARAEGLGEFRLPFRSRVVVEWHGERHLAVEDDQSEFRSTRPGRENEAVVAAEDLGHETEHEILVGRLVDGIGRVDYQHDVALAHSVGGGYRLVPAECVAAHKREYGRHEQGEPEGEEGGAGFLHRRDDERWGCVRVCVCGIEGLCFFLLLCHKTELCRSTNVAVASGSPRRLTSSCLLSPKTSHVNITYYRYQMQLKLSVYTLY